MPRIKRETPQERTKRISEEQGKYREVIRERLQGQSAFWYGLVKLRGLDDTGRSVPFLGLVRTHFNERGMEVEGHSDRLVPTVEVVHTETGDVLYSGPPESVAGGRGGRYRYTALLPVPGDVAITVEREGRRTPSMAKG